MRDVTNTAALARHSQNHKHGRGKGSATSVSSYESARPCCLDLVAEFKIRPYFDKVSFTMVKKSATFWSKFYVQWNL